MSRLDRILRPNVRQLQPYVSARDEFNESGAILLDANENAFSLNSRHVLSRYPDPRQIQLKSEIAKLKNVDVHCVFVGNGSDEAIDLLIRAFCRPGLDNVMVAPPTYGMYEVAASLNDVQVVEAPLDAEFQFDRSRFSAALTPHTKILFLCSPNNPSGNCLNAPAVEGVLRSFDGIVVVDEAYIDFCPDRSWLPRLGEFDNLVVLQTLSKAWGLASLRVGMTFASPEIIDVLTRIKPPYNVSGVSQAIALEHLVEQEAMRKTVQTLVQERRRLLAHLERLDAVEHVFPSEANFLLVRVVDAGAIYRHLALHGVIVRDRSSLPGCESCLRITVGTPEQNERLVSHLESWREST